MTHRQPWLAAAMIVALTAVDGCSGDERPALPDGLVVIDNVTVVDARGTRAGRAVLLQGQTIFEIVARGGAWPADARVIDGAGGYLAPGLVDPHVHLSLAGATVWGGDTLQQNLRATLYHGVTAVMDVGGPELLFELRDRIEAGELVGPTIRATGPFLTEEGSHPCETFPYPQQCHFVDAGSAEQRARALVAAGADAIKVALADAAFTPWPTTRLDQLALERIAAVAPKVIAHVDSNRDAIDAVAAGVQVLGHPVFDAPLTAEALAACHEAQVVHSTLGAFAGVLELIAGDVDLGGKALAPLPVSVGENWRRIREDPSVLLDGWVEQSKGWAAAARANVERMHEAGVTLLPASDAGYLFVPHGYGLHQELRRLAAIGLPAQKLLELSTRDARQAIGLAGGLVEPGAPADLLLLENDPSLDVEAWQQIGLVVLRGRPLTRDEILQLDLIAGDVQDAGICFEPADCGDGLTCDAIDRRCRQSCAEPFAAVDRCGAQAWCMPEDGVVGTEAGVCRIEADAGCDLYAQDCGPDGYTMACVPLDADTNGCRLGGTATGGQPCKYSDLGSSCAPGFYCSPFDATCYQLCDPAATPDPCPPTTSCKEQRATPTDAAPWFGLCL